MRNIVFHYNNETFCSTTILQAYARTMRTLTYSSKSPFHYTNKIHNIYSSRTFYMFRLHV